jgi:hypothetical protein
MRLSATLRFVLAIWVGSSLACSRGDREHGVDEPPSSERHPAASSPSSHEQLRGACDPAAFVDVAELPSALAAAPTSLGTHELKPGAKHREDELELWTGPHFVPTQVGASTGRMNTFLRGAIQPDYDRGDAGLDDYSHIGIESADNHWVGQARQFRWLIDRMDPQSGSVWVVLDRVACGSTLFLPRLEPGEIRRVWMSTQGIRHLDFVGSPPFGDEQVKVWLDPFADWSAEDGRWLLRPGAWASEGEHGEQPFTLNPSSPEFRPFVRRGPYTVQFERVVTGEGTAWSGAKRHLIAPHRVPNVHVLVAVQRDA